MGQIKWRGAHAAEFLERVTVADVADLRKGAAARAVLRRALLWLGHRQRGIAAGSSSSVAPTHVRAACRFAGEAKLTLVTNAAGGIIDDAMVSSHGDYLCVPPAWRASSHARRAVRMARSGRPLLRCWQPTVEHRRRAPPPAATWS